MTTRITYQVYDTRTGKVVQAATPNGSPIIDRMMAYRIAINHDLKINLNVHEVRIAK